MQMPGSTPQDSWNASVNDADFSTLCARISAALDVRDVIDLLDYMSEKAIHSAGLWRLYCPLHGEKVFRTLVINPRRNTYFCEYSACEAHQPGDLIDMLARVHGMSAAEMVLHLVKKLGVEKLRLSEEQARQLKAHALSVAGKP